MSTSPKQEPRTKTPSSSDQSPRPDHKGGNAVANARKWGGGSEASKGSITAADRHNENSSAKS